MKRLAFLGAILLTSGGCLVHAIMKIVETTSSGSLAVAGPSFGEGRFAPSECSSGDREFFWGVDLRDAGRGIVVRLVSDPIRGVGLRVTGGTGDSVFFEPGSCKLLRARIEPTGWRVNEVRDLRGRIEADCDDSRGNRVSGDLSFDHCH